MRVTIFRKIPVGNRALCLLITKAVHKLVKKSLDEEDWATWDFMQWFVKEQVEVETLAMNLLDKMKIAGGEKMSSNASYSFDKDINKRIEYEISN